MEDYNEIAKKNIYDIYKFSSPESLGQFNQIWHKASLGKGVQVFRNKGHSILKKENKKNYFFFINLML